MLREGVAAKIWTQIWGLGNLVWGGRLLRSVFGTSTFSNFPNLSSRWLNYRSLGLRYSFYIGNATISDMKLGPRPPLYRYFRANEREKLPKPGQNSDFGPNPDISQSFCRCMRVVVHPRASFMSQTQVLASPSTRLAWFGLILFTRAANRNLQWCHFGFPSGITTGLLQWPVVDKNWEYFCWICSRTY